MTVVIKCARITHADSLLVKDTILTSSHHEFDWGHIMKRLFFTGSVFAVCIFWFVLSFHSSFAEIPSSLDEIPLKLNYESPEFTISLKNGYLTLKTDWTPLFEDNVNVKITYKDAPSIKLPNSSSDGVYQSRYKEDASSLENIDSIILESIADNDHDSELVVIGFDGTLQTLEVTKGLEFATYTSKSGVQGYNYSYGLEKGSSSLPLVEYAVYFDASGKLKNYRVLDSDDRELTYSGSGELEAVERLIRSSNTGVVQRIHWDFSDKKWKNDQGEVVDYNDDVYNDKVKESSPTQPPVITIQPVEEEELFAITPTPRKDASATPAPSASASPQASSTPAPSKKPYVVLPPPVKLSDLKVAVNPETLKHLQLGTITSSEHSASIKDLNYTAVSVTYVSGGVKTTVELSKNTDSASWVCDNMPDGFALSTAVFTVTDNYGLSTKYKNMEVLSSSFLSDPSLELLADNTYRYDGTDRENVLALYASEGDLEAYSYHTEDESKSITYNPYGDVLSYSASSSNGKKYKYSADQGWYVLGEDGAWAPTDKPDDVNPSDLPPLLVLERKTEPKVVWYPNNTVGVIGIPLRETYPGLTNKWYNVLPVDISHNGIQSFKLVAANMFYIGRVYVNVMDDYVTVDYQLAGGHVYPKTEFYRWFTSIDEISSEFLEAPKNGMKYGRPYSRKDDLNDQSIALLFVCNTVTFRQPVNNHGGMLVRFWPNIHEVIQHREAAKKLLWQMDKEKMERNR